MPLTVRAFPVESGRVLQIIARLYAAIQDLRQSDLTHNIGTLYPRVNRLATRAFIAFLHHNPNNLGNWSITNDKSGTRQLEFEVIHKLIHLYHAKPTQSEGYITSGGTEGNLYSVWIGKAYLETHLTLDQMCLLKTKLTHYSIDKACSMGSLPAIDIPLNSASWTMDVTSLKHKILALIRQGKKGFIISLTHGYTETGTSDDIQKISAVVDDIISEHTNVYVSIIIDAAFDGLVLPFTTNTYKPLYSRHVHSFSVDFSKFTAVPYPAGVVLYKKRLRKLIEKEVPVFSMKDNTVSGSRPGASAAAIWTAIHQLGRLGFTRVITKQLKLKGLFINKIKELYPYSEIISSPTSLTCGVILNTNTPKRLPSDIERKYWLYAKKTQFEFERGQKKEGILYKFFFMQHVTEKSIKDFFSDIQRASSNGKLY